MSESFAVASGAIGELFFNVNDAVAVARPGRVVAWNPAAEQILGLPNAEATAPHADLNLVFGEGTAAFWHLVDAGGQSVIECRGGCERILEAMAWRLGNEPGGPTIIVMHDVTVERRHAKGLQTLNLLARQLLAETSLDVLLARIVDAAKELTRADFSALVTVREGSMEVEQFVYNAPRELFPARLPDSLACWRCRSPPAPRRASTASAATPRASGSPSSTRPSPPCWPRPSSPAIA